MPKTLARTSGRIRAALVIAFADELREAASAESHGREGDRITAEQFSECVADAIDSYGVTAAAFCSEFGVTRATVSRWRSGDAIPIGYIRRQVFLWLAAQLERQAGEPNDSNVLKILEVAREG